MSQATINRNALSVEGRDLSSDAFGALLDAFNTPALTIEVESVTPDTDGSKNFKIKGQTQIFAQSVVVTLYLDFVSDTKFEFQFKTIIPSLNFQTLRDQKVVPDGASLGPLVSTAYSDLEFTFDSEDARLHIACLESPARIDLFPKLALEKLGFEFLRSYVQQTALLDVYAEIKIGSTPIDVKIEIPLGGMLSPKCWAVTSRSTIPFGSWLADLTQFLGDTVGVSATNVFPESLKGIGTFFLDDVQILIDPGRRSLQHLSFRIRSVRELKIAESLAISNVGMRVTVTPATERTDVSLTLFGHIKIKEEVNLDIQVMLPANLSQDPWDFFMSGGLDLKDLSELEHLPVGHKAEDLKLHSGFLTLTSLELKKFEVAFNPIQKTVPNIAFDLAVFAECELVHGFKLKDPRFELTAVNPLDQAGLPAKSLTGAIAGVISIDDINFGIEARKRDDGWDFIGQTAPQAIHLSALITALEGKYATPLPKIIQDDLTLESLRVEFSTTTQATNSSSAVLFSAEIDFPIHDDPNTQKGRLRFDAHFTDGPQKTHEFGGALTIGSVGFGTRYSDNANASFFAGAYSDSKNENIKLSDLVKNVSSSLAELIPDGLGIVIKDAVFAFAKPGQDPRKFLFGMDIGLHCDFTRLPLVGKYFSGPDAAKIGIDNLKIVFASRPFVATEVQNVNQLLATFVPPVSQLPDVTKTTSTTPGAGNTPPDATTPVLQQGANVAAVLNLGGSSRPLSFPASAGAQQPNAAAQPIPNATTGDSAIWLNIQKAIGPVHFERVGVEYRQSKLWVLLSASLTAAGLKISLDGLSLGTSLESFDLKAALRGLGIDYRNDFVEIGGSFSATPAKDADTEPEYSGAVTLKARGLTISAFGKYTTIDQHPSLFIYGRLDYPIGGPPFFFVTGLVAGFGYQRQLVIPSIEKLGQFSLIKATQQSSSFIDVLQDPNLSKQIPPTAGEHFLAAGVIFTSFKLVESTVLLFAAFGKRFELHLLGLSKMRMPAALPDDASPVDPVAEVELAVKGSFIPDEGFLELRAQLTPTSYLFSKNCHLTGGFAFVCWFKPKPGTKSTGPEGDFILTLGGYHPAFHVPPHYPPVPRLGFNWQVTPDTLSLRGEVYFALTPAAVMAGGYLQAEWHSGKVRAWFKAGVDFLIAWKPYHYDARAYIDIGVEVTFEFFGTQRLSLDVGADLHIWGPDFAGEATIHLWIISFTIHFGNQDQNKRPAIEWSEFQSSFLLKEKPQPGQPKPEVCSVVVSDGLVQKGDGNDLGVINGKHFCLRTDSRIPATAAQCNGTTLKVDDKLAKTFGVAPVGIESVKSSTHSITLMRDNQPIGKDEFDFIALDKNFPAALWGRSVTPQVNGPQFINALGGFEIRPLKLQESDDAKATVDRSELVKHDPKPQQYSWEPAAKAFNPVQKTEQQFQDDLKAVSNTTRKTLLASLGVDFDDLDDSLTYGFLKQPQSEAA